MKVRQGCSTLFVVVFAVTVALTIASTAFEAMSARTEISKFEPSGRLVTIRPHRLHIDCRGQGLPIVVLEAGRDRFSLDWSAVQSRLAEDVMVCSYDRAGYGWSGRGPGARTPERIADELHELFIRAEIVEPYVFVAMDAGALYSLEYAATYPEEVAGMVWIAPHYGGSANSLGSSEDRWLESSRVFGHEWTALSVGSRLGLWPRVQTHIYSERLSAQDETAKDLHSALLRLPGHFTTAAREAASDKRIVGEDAVELPALANGIPSLVIASKANSANSTSAEGVDREPSDAEVRWTAMQAALSANFEDSDVVRLDSDGSDLTLTEPDAIYEGVMSIVQRVREADSPEGADEGGADRPFELATLSARSLASELEGSGR